MKEFRAKLVSSAIGAIKDNAKAGQLRARNYAAAEESKIFRVEGFIGREDRRILGWRVRAVLENVFFQDFLDGIGEFHSCGGEELYAVVVKGVVGGGDNDASLKTLLTHEAGDTGRGDYAGESHGGAGVDEASGKKRGDVRAGFARVHANENAGGGLDALEISAEGTAGGEE